MDVFLDKFSSPQGIRLQDLTYGDMLTVVRDTLEGNKNFLALKKPQGGGAALISQVTERSSGVFLWVALVVKLLDDACDAGDTFAELQRKIDSTPSEIEDLFQQLYDSIHKSDRDQSAQTFAIILRLLQNKSGTQMSLLRYSLLDEYNTDTEFASKPEFERQDFLHENENEVKLRLKRARRQLYKRCRGLLEVISSDSDHLTEEYGNGYFQGTFLSSRVSLTHRSVQEFLLRDSMEQERSARLQGFDVFGAISQTFVAELAFLHLRRPDFDDMHYSLELGNIVSSIAKSVSDPEKPIQALWNLESVRNRYFPPNHPYTINYRSNPMCPTVPVISDRFSVAHCAAYFGLHQFFTNDIRPSFVVDKVGDGSLALCTIKTAPDALTRALISHEGRNMTLKWIFQQGCSPNKKVIMNNDASLWCIFLSDIWAKDRPKLKNFAEILQTFLEFGAYRDISITVPEDGMIIHSPSPIGTSKIESDFYFNSSDYPPIHEITELIESKDGRATLRDYILNCELANKDVLLDLLDAGSHARHMVVVPSLGLVGLTPKKDNTSPIESEEAEPGVSVLLEEIYTPGVRTTLEQMLLWIRSVLGNSLFTFVLGKTLTIRLLLL